MKMVKYVSYLYTVLVAISLSMLVTSIMKYTFTQPAAINVPRAVSNTVTDALRTQLALALAERNIFAVDIEEFVPRAEGGEGIEGEEGYVPPPPTFNGTLTGIIMSSDPAKHRVIITVDKEIYILSINITKDGYTLKSVTLNSAVVNFSGRDYTLVLDSSKTQMASAPAPTRPQPPQPSREIPKAEPKPAGESGGTLQYTLERGELMDQLKDINTVLRSLLVSPTYVDGDFVGYRVTRMNNDSPMKALGLQQGDIINRLNGEELTSPEILFGMLGKVDTLNAVSVDITRNGEKKTLFVEIQ